MRKLYVLLIVLTWQATLSLAQPGALDNSFGNFGTQFGPFVSGINHGKAMALQPDGKIVITGFVEVAGGNDIFVIRYNPDGSFDPSFGNSGYVITNVSPSADVGNAIAVQTDGKIVVAGDYTTGSLSSNFQLLRYTASGGLDPAFGIGGSVIVDFNSNSGDAVRGMVLQPDGKIVIAGWTFTGDKDIALLRFNNDGTLDSSFGANGKVFTDINNQYQEANAIALQPDGKILVAGLSSTSTTANDVALFRYNTDGSLDNTFGTNGITLSVVSSDDDAAKAIVLQNDGKIVIAGYTYTIFIYADNLIMRFDSTGNPDTSFNSTGIIVSDINGYDNFSTGVVLQSDGKIVTTGRAFNTSLDFSLSRFNTDGSLDQSFGNSGHVLTNMALDIDESFASVVQPDDKILLTGYYGDSGLENLIVARYLNDSTPVNIADTYINDKIIIYPQPAENILNVYLNGSNDNVIHEIEIYSATGAVIKRITNVPQILSLDVSQLQPGLYLMRVVDTNSNNFAGKKFIKN